MDDAKCGREDERGEAGRVVLLTFHFCLSSLGGSGPHGILIWLVFSYMGFLVVGVVLTHRHMILTLELEWIVILLTERRTIREGIGVCEDSRTRYLKNIS